MLIACPASAVKSKHGAPDRHSPGKGAQELISGWILSSVPEAVVMLPEGNYASTRTSSTQRHGKKKFRRSPSAHLAELQIMGLPCGTSRRLHKGTNRRF